MKTKTWLRSNALHPFRPSFANYSTSFPRLLHRCIPPPSGTDPYQHRTQPRTRGLVACASGSAWTTWTYLAGCSALSHVVEKHTAVGSVLSSPLIAMVLAGTAAWAGVLPAGAVAYDVILNYLMPLAASCYLLECDISSLFSRKNTQALIGFVNGSFGTLLGTAIAFYLVGNKLGLEGTKVAAALCASYIGGSVNFVAVSMMLGISSPVMAAACCADNFAMAIYLSMLMALARGEKVPLPDLSDVGASISALPAASQVTDEGLAITLAAAALSCAIGQRLARQFGFATAGLAFTALVAPVLASVASFLRRKPRTFGFLHFSGGNAIGGALMPLFFATIGVAAGSVQSLASSGWLLTFIAIQLSTQLAVSLVLGRAMSLPLPIVLITANANVGGPATAAAMAAAKNWHSLVQPAIMTGTLGYAIANWFGLSMATWLAAW